MIDRLLDWTIYLTASRNWYTLVKKSMMAKNGHFRSVHFFLGNGYVRMYGSNQLI
jgi:hypothetical protein